MNAKYVVSFLAAILAVFLCSSANAQTGATRPPYRLDQLTTQPTHTFPCVPGGSTASLQACTLASYFSFSGSALGINTMVGDSGAGGAVGLVPAPAAGDAAASKFLKADATWAVPAGGGGGSGTVNSGIAGQLGYYATSTTAISGNANATISAGALSLGVNATTLGTLGLFGSTSGKITIQPQAAAGTYNFNLPTTSGSAGQPMLSGGGGAAPQTYGTLSVGGGGTGGTSFTQNALLKGGGTNSFSPSSLIDNGSIVSTAEPISTQSSPFITEILNDTTVGTVVNKLAKVAGSPSRAQIATTTDTSGNVVGVVFGNAGLSGSAQIAVDGQVQCVFDGATVANHFVQASTTAGGSCHDAGAGYPNNGQQVLGLVLSTNGAGGTYNMKVFPSGIVPTGGASVAGDNAWTGRNRIVSTPLSDAATILVDANGPNVRTVTLAGNRTLANPTNILGGEMITFIINQDVVGGRTLSLGSMYAFPNGDPPVFTTLAGARDMFTCFFGQTQGNCGAPILNILQVRLNTFDVARDGGGEITYSNNNIIATRSSGSGDDKAPTTLFRSSGKWVFRVYYTTCVTAGGGGSCGVGLASSTASTQSSPLGVDTVSVGIYSDGRILVNNGVNVGPIGFTFGTGDYLDVVVDLTAKTIQAAKNGGALSSSASIASMSTFNLSPACNLHQVGDVCRYSGSPSISYSGATNWQ